MQYDTELGSLRKCVAAKINGILKQEYDIETKLRRKIVDESIQIYNEWHPHLLNNYITQNQMHKLSE
ncbi:hypothetical protein [Chryseobacterium sp. 3008163]|uniref:hypothetical protein n=1 Tax=Chryseobacterium sp. 3008163 TaxID=2478663 RepID=UPI001013C7C7|nr:hypothetical protein [Chryseobacterium sp. 3008163]